LIFAWGLTFTPIFHAKVVRVEGIRRLGSRQVMRIAQITPGTNVFHLDASAAEKRLEQAPWVAAATVTIRLPSTVLIAVTERSPVALVRRADGGAGLVAGDGVVVGQATGREPMPTIDGADIVAIPDAATLRAGADAAASMSPLLRSEASSIEVGSEGSFLVLLRSGVAVSYGQPSDLEAKGQALEAVLTWAQQQGKKVVAIDVTVPAAPSATLAGGAVAAP
jgi:cell division protein FtsQ